MLEWNTKTIFKTVRHHLDFGGEFTCNGMLQDKTILFTEAFQMKSNHCCQFKFNKSQKTESVVSHIMSTIVLHLTAI